MKAIRCDLPYADVIELHPLADLHIGDMCSDYKLIMERLEHIKNTANAYCILGGDLMDTALPGNHENRVYKADGIDLTALMCSQLGVAEKYSSTTAVLFIRFGKGAAQGHKDRRQLYTVYATHGSGGGRKEGGKVNRLADLSSIVDCDIYIHGHTHLPFVFKENFMRPSRTTSTVEPVEKLFVNTAAWLNYGGYGDKAGFKPASKRSPVIYLDGQKHDMWAQL